MRSILLYPSFSLGGDCSSQIEVCIHLGCIANPTVVPLSPNANVLILIRQMVPVSSVVVVTSDQLIVAAKKVLGAALGG